MLTVDDQGGFSFETSEATTLAANSAYIISEVPITTAISEMVVKAVADGIYTIDGRRVQNLQKGLNIVRTQDSVRKLMVK